MTFHRLIPEDWHLPDPLSVRCTVSATDGSPTEMDGAAWAALFLSVELHPSVPAEIRDLFEVAKGTLVYGWFYYPLYDGGQQQLFRLAEAAAFHRYRELGGPRERLSFQKTIDWLAETGAMNAGTVEQWHALRKLRNEGAHPKHRVVVPPGHASRVLANVAMAVNSMFSTAREAK